MASQRVNTHNEPKLEEGRIQACEGFLLKKSKYLKRWKRAYFKVVSGKLLNCYICSGGSRGVALVAFATPFVTRIT